MMDIHELHQYPTLAQFSSEGEELMIGHLRLSDLVAKFGTPLYVYDGAAEVSVPKIEPGDVVGLFYAGAYGYSFSMLDFLGHLRPAEVLVYQNHAYLIRERGSFNDLKYKQFMPALG